MHAEHRAAEVEVYGTSPMLGLTLREVRLRDTSGVVHQHVQTTELIFGKGDHLGHVGLGNHVNKYESRPPTFGVDLTNSAGASVFVDVCDDDSCSLMGESPGNRSSY